MARKGGLPTLGAGHMGTLAARPRGMGKLPSEQKTDPFAVFPPFGSRLEVAAYKYCITKSPYWTSQGQFGRVRSYGSTRVDLFNPVLGVAFYIDGAYWHRYKTAQDLVDRRIVASRGYRVVALEWNSTPEALYAFMPRFYAANIG